MVNTQEREGRHVQNRRTSPKKKKKKVNFLKMLSRIFLLLLVILVVLMGIAFAVVSDKCAKINYTEIDINNAGIDDNVDNDIKNYRNIALFGVDTRDIKNNKGSRSDAIIIVSINKFTNEIKLVSVYRDTYVYIEGHGFDKITHAYAYGGPELAIKTLNENLDLNIKEYITVNFASVANIIDSIGGIDVNIEEYEIEQMNKYIKDTSKNTGIASSPIEEAGMQTLDGVQAVTYSRIRKNVGGDSKRNERMRTVLSETLKKTKKQNLATINYMLDTICENIETNITANKITFLIPRIFLADVKQSVGWPYETKGITLDRWYGVPVNLEKNVSELHKDLFGQENYQPSERVQEFSNKIMNKTGIR